MRNAFGFILLTLLLACKNEPTKSKYFEGYVDYKVESIASDTSAQFQQYAKSSGNSMRCYFKNGNYMREYFDSNNISTRKLLYQVLTNRFIDLNKNYTYYGFSQPDDEENANGIANWKIVDANVKKVVLDRNCTGFKCSYLIKKGMLKTILTFYYAKDLPFDFPNFRKSADPFLRYLSNRFPFIALLFIEEYVGRVKTTHTATRIVPTLLSDTLFTVPNDKPLIHY